MNSGPNLLYVCDRFGPLVLQRQFTFIINVFGSLMFVIYYFIIKLVASRFLNQLALVGSYCFIS